MMKSSKIVSLLLILVMVFSLSVPIMAAEKPITVKLCNYMDKSGKWVSEKTIKFDVDPIIEDGRTMVPIRAVAEELGYDVEWRQSSWEDEAGSAIIVYNMPKGTDYNKKNQTLRLVNLLYNLEAKNDLAPTSFGKLVFDAHTEHSSVGGLLDAEHGSKRIAVEMTVYKKMQKSATGRLTLWDSPCMCGATYKMDVSPYVKDGRTLLPLRAVGEMLGLDVSWDGNTRTVKISA